MKKNQLKNAFTLIELTVSITILSIIMISIFTIFQLTTQLNNKTEISRALQENSKNVVELIAEDIRLQWVTGVNSDPFNPWCTLSSTQMFSSGSKLCVWGNSYYLAKFDSVLSAYKIISSFSDCDGKELCRLVKRTSDGTVTPISNSWVDFRSLRFYVSGGNNLEQKKISVSYEMLPSSKKWISHSLIENNRLQVQTTVTQNIYKIN